MTDIAEAVRQTIRQIKGAELDKDAPLPDDAHLTEDLMFDSYDHVELMFELELRFEMPPGEVSLEEMAELRTVEDIIDFITKKTT